MVENELDWFRRTGNELLDAINSIHKFGQTWIVCPSPSIEEPDKIHFRRIIFKLKGRRKN
ncbi:MAG: hypothetical protein ACFFD2_01540 [Promethearchaeota archaeon]